MHQKYKLFPAAGSHIKICVEALLFFFFAEDGLVSSSCRDFFGTDLDAVACLNIALGHVTRPDEIKNSEAAPAAGDRNRFSGGDIGGRVKSKRHLCVGHDH